jgi:hypothetical protein
MHTSGAIIVSLSAAPDQPRARFRFSRGERLMTTRTGPFRIVIVGGGVAVLEVVIGHRQRVGRVLLVER